MFLIQKYFIALILYCKRAVNCTDFKNISNNILQNNINWYLRTLQFFRYRRVHARKLLLGGIYHQMLQLKLYLVDIQMKTLTFFIIWFLHLQNFVKGHLYPRTPMNIWRKIQRNKGKLKKPRRRKRRRTKKRRKTKRTQSEWILVFQWWFCPNVAGFHLNNVSDLKCSNMYVCLAAF